MITNPEPMDVAAAARELGYTRPTVRKHARELGGYRINRRGPWRFTPEAIAQHRATPKFIDQPKTTLAEHARLLRQLEARLVQEEIRRIEADKKLEAALAKLSRP